MPGRNVNVGSAIVREIIEDDYLDPKTNEFISVKSMSQFNGKVILIVNINGHYVDGFDDDPNELKELQEIYDKYKNWGFEIFGFPEWSYYETVKLSENLKTIYRNKYGITFKLFDAEYRRDLFDKLTINAVTGDKKISMYDKFLIDKNGNIIERWDGNIIINKTAILNSIETTINQNQ